MVHRDPPVFLVAVLEQRRLDHPAERPRIVGDQLEPRRHLAAETVERHVDPVLLVGDDADEVAVGGAGPLHDPFELLGERNFSTGERIEPSEPTAIQTSPAAPRPLASSINRSSSLREDDPARGERLDHPPSPSTFANALKAVDGEDRPRSTSSMP